MRYDSTITTTKEFFINHHGSYSVNIFTLILHDSKGKYTPKLLTDKDIKHLLSKYPSSKEYVKRYKTVKKIILLAALTEIASIVALAANAIQYKPTADEQKPYAEPPPYILAFALSNFSLIALAHQPTYIRFAGILEYNRIVLQRNIAKNKF